MPTEVTPAILVQTFHSPLGPVTLAQTGEKVVCIHLGDTGDVTRRYLKRNFPLAKVLPLKSGLLPAVRELKEYFSGRRRHFSFDLALLGTPFQRRVWQALARIPYGQVRSYGSIARAVGRPQAARAVGAACGKNPLPIVIPCHRVLTGSGRLGGFSGGLWRKKVLLKLEKRP